MTTNGRYAKITGVGGHLPARALSNDMLSEFVDTSDEWVRSRTGIGSRYFAEEGQLASDLALPAAQQALRQARITGGDLDMIVFATTTPDRVYPATACILQEKLDAAPCAAFDVQAVCSGFLYALSIAEAMIVAGRARRVMVVGAEVFSHTLDWNDRATCVLFGDGAGAAVLESSSRPGVAAIRLFANGRHVDKLTVAAHLLHGKLEGDPYTRMDGGAVYRFAVEKMAESARQVMAESELSPDWLILHQANSRIIESVRKRLGIAAAKTLLSLEEHGNTSAASIPLALAEHRHRFRDGDNLLLAAVGGGFTWAAAMITWRE